MCYLQKEVIVVTEVEILEAAESEGFIASLITPEQVPIVPEFRMFCEENRCGKYNANYSCPPDCGTVQQLQNRVLAEELVLVVTSQWEIQGYEDQEGIQVSKKAHNAAVLRLMDKLRKIGIQGFAVGYSGCPLCNPCKRTLNQPCAFPDKRISCMSAYCVNVAELANRCGMDFAWDSNRLYLFGMIPYHTKSGSY